jgi:hypothetical protein
MITKFIQQALARAKYEKIKDPLPHYGKIPGFAGLWAQGKTLRECKKNLQEALEEWLIIKIRKQQSIPKTKQVV